MAKKAMMTSMTQPMARLRSLKRSARTRETMLLLPFCSCGGRHGLLTGWSMAVVAVVCQLQEEVFERGVLRCQLIDAGIGVDQRSHQLWGALRRQRNGNRAWAADLWRHAEARHHL